MELYSRGSKALQARRLEADGKPRGVEARVRPHQKNLMRGDINVILLMVAKSIPTANSVEPFLV